VTIEDFLDTGAFTAWLEKLDRVSCNVGRHWRTLYGPPSLVEFSTDVTTILSLFSSKVFMLREKLPPK
jgi:hypothetical protein